MTRAILHRGKIEANSETSQLIDKILNIGSHILHVLLLSALLLIQLYTLPLRFVTSKLGAHQECSGSSNLTVSLSRSKTTFQNTQSNQLPSRWTLNSILEHWSFLTLPLQHILGLYCLADRTEAELRLPQSSSKSPKARKKSRMSFQAHGVRSLLARDDAWSHLLAIAAQTIHTVMPDDDVLKDLALNLKDILPDYQLKLSLLPTARNIRSHSQTDVNYHHASTQTPIGLSKESQSAANEVIHTLPFRGERSAVSEGTCVKPEQAIRAIVGQCCELNDSSEHSGDSMKITREQEDSGALTIECQEDAGIKGCPIFERRQAFSRLPKKTGSVGRKVETSPKTSIFGVS